MNQRRKESIQRQYGRLRPWSRHGLVLVVAGISFIIWGLTFAFYIPGGSRWEALVVARNVMPISSWGYVFLAAGLLMILSSRWPYNNRLWGYTVLTFMTLCWSGFYFMGAPLVPEPVSNLEFGAYWLLQAALWWAISGLVNPKAVFNGSR